MKKRLPNIDLTPSQYRDVKKLIKLYLPDAEVWAYGSRVTFKARHNSDLDLVAFVGKEKRSAVYSLKDAFVESRLPFSVDVMMWETIPDHFKPNIRRAYYVLQESEASNKKLKAVKLGEVSDIIGGGTPSTADAKNYGGAIPWITPRDLSSYSQRYIKRGARNITKKGLASSGARMLPANTVLFSTRAPIGYIAIAANEISTNQGFKGLVLKDGHIPEFYYYLLKHHTPGIIAYSSGSTFGEITANALNSFEVKVPDTQTQKAIAHVLGFLDEKIEHNQKVSETLEETAKAIFRSWFVDFAPVRAKMEGRPTGLSPDISALFPEKLTQSKIGEIPQGWKIQALGEHIDIAKGRTYKSAELQPSNIALVTLKSFLRGGGYRHDGLKEYIGEYNPEQVLTEGDVIFALTDLTQAADVVGRPAIVRKSRVYDKLIASLDVGIIKIPEAKLVTKEFCYYLMLTRQYAGHVIGHTSGTTVLHLSKDAPLRYKFCAPPKEIVKIFSKIAASTQQKILNAEKESTTLSELRDTLLPKLISGELQIKDAEKLIKRAKV